MQLDKLVTLAALAASCLALGLVLCQGDVEGVTKGSNSRSISALPKIFDFERFKSKYNRTYKSIVEELARKKIFLARAFQAFLSTIGYRSLKRDYRLEINHLSDWTIPEFEATLNRRSRSKSNNAPIPDNEDQSGTPAASEEEIKTKLANIIADPRNAELAEELRLGGVRRRRDAVNPVFDDPSADNDDEQEGRSLRASGRRGGFFENLFSQDKKKRQPSNHDQLFVDHRRSGCLGTVKDQKQCGCCYIFSTNALYEFQYCKEFGKSISLSEQYPLDCGERVGLEACGGGNELSVSRFYKQFGLELSENYLYRSRSDLCPYEPDFSSNKMGQIRLDGTGGLVGVRHDFLERRLEHSPILVELGVTEDFSSYGSGVDPGKTCEESRGHSMLMVGHGRENGKDYWLLRNSYGTDWGIEGHYKLNKKAKHCILDDGVGYVLKSKPGSTIFDTNPNKDYSDTHVKNRLEDVKNNRAIPENPVNYVHNDEHSANIVTPASRGARAEHLVKKQTTDTEKVN